MRMPCTSYPAAWIVSRTWVRNFAASSNCDGYDFASIVIKPVMARTFGFARSAALNAGERAAVNRTIAGRIRFECTITLVYPSTLRCEPNYAGRSCRSYILWSSLFGTAKGGFVAQVYLILLAILTFMGLYVIFGSFFTVETAEVAVITRFGKFLRIADAGLNWKSPFFDSVAGRVSLRVVQITLTMETKTKDNVFVTIPISVQNRVRPEKVFDAYYKLADPVAQIKSYVEQVILGHVPGMTLDEVFASQSSIAAAVKQELDADMAGFGYEIVNVLVTDIVPDSKVKSAMNDINAAQREQVAANARGEAEKILVVKKAEAQAESTALQGQGIANQRKAIIEGLQVSIEQFQKVVEGASAKEVMQLVMVTQYFDTLKSIGENDRTNTLFLAHSPGTVKEVSDQILDSMMGANASKPQSA